MTAARKYGDVWSKPAAHLSDLLAAGGAHPGTLRSALELGYFSQYTALADATFVDRVIDWQIELLAPRFGSSLDALPPQVAELPIVPPATLASRFGRPLTPDLLRNIWYVARIEDTLGWGRERTPAMVLEIGSGYGAFAAVIKAFHPRARVWLVDLVESLRIAQIYLQAHFPDARFVIVEDGTDSAAIDNADFVLIAVERSRCLAGRKFDLAVNIWSFGEMPNSFVGKWFDLIQQQAAVESLFTLNAFMAPVTHIARDRAAQGDWLFRLDERWDIRSFEVDPAIHRCPYIRNFYTGIGITAQRVHDDAELQRLKDSAMTEAAEIGTQDWVRLLRSDTAISVAALMYSTEYIGHFDVADARVDPLFRLWNDFRLNRTAASGALLVGYLAMVGKTDLAKRCTKEEIQLLQRLPHGPLHAEYANLVEQPETAIEHRNAIYTVQQACDYALACRAAGDLLQAEEVFIKVAAVAPRYGDAWYYLALIAQSQQHGLMAAVRATHAWHLAPGYEHYASLCRALRRSRAIAWASAFASVVRTRLLVRAAAVLLSVKCTRAAERLSALAFVRSCNGAFCFPTLALALKAQGATEAAGSFEAAVQTY